MASATKLAYYAAEAMAVLAPRGWHCIEMYGSGGAFLLVTPQLYTADTLPGFNSLRGPAIELLFANGANSGRHVVAEILSRLFPFEHRFIHDVTELDETLGSPQHFNSGPYPTDRTIRRSRTEVDFTTPPYRGGMGTFASRLGSGASPIIGTAILAQQDRVDNVVSLRLRLPPDLLALAPTILDVARKTQADPWSISPPRP